MSYTVLDHSYLCARFNQGHKPWLSGFTKGAFHDVDNYLLG